MKKNTTFRFAFVATVAAVLTACGGGSGGDSSASATTTGSTSTGSTSTGSTSTGSTTTGSTGTTTGSTGTGSTTTTTSSTDTSLVTTAPATTYATGSDEAIAFALINSERLKCGFGAVTQNADLDTAAANHATYIVNRLEDDIVSAHTEDPTLSGYTGVNPGDRATAAGYSWSYIDENIGYYAPGTALGYQQGNVRALFATVYHLAGMVSGARDAGLSLKVAPSGEQLAVMEWLGGVSSTAVQQQTTGLVTYPCDGTTGVQPYMYSEVPDPFANLGFTSGSGVGQPLYFKAPQGSTIVLTSATLTSAAGATIPTTLYHYTDDPNGQLTANQAFVIPRAALALSTTYTAAVTGTIDGTAFNKTFSFTTESAM